jgi:catechol 2,3-dioxygenase-like lactoylglutathione lyase family enzyme
MPLDIRGLAPLLPVFDMPRSIHFYRDLLGFEVVQTSPPGDDCDWALLRLHGIELMLNTAYERDVRPAAADPGRHAAHADTSLYFGCPDVDGAHALLRGQGLDLRAPVIAPYGMKQLVLSDPDGYTLCFQWPTDGRWDSGGQP